MTRHALILAAAALIAPPALADEAPRLIAALTGDWNEDGNPDAVLLYSHTDEMADLVLLLGHDWAGLQPAIALEQVVYFGGMAGQVPRLETRGATGFRVLSEQTGIGREPWQQALSVAYRRGEFQVAGFDFLFYDRLDPTHNGACSLNLLTGRYTLTIGPGDEAPEITREGQSDLRAFPLARLEAEFFPEVCRAIFE